MAISIPTRMGRVIASDCFFKYGNIESGHQIGISESLDEWHRAYARIRREADVFIPLYDPEVLQRHSGGAIGWGMKQAQFGDPLKTLDNLDFTFNKKMNRSLVFKLAARAFIGRDEDALFLGPPGTGKSRLAQAIGQAVIQQGYRVLYRETHTLLDELAEARLDGTRKECLGSPVTVPLLILDDFGMRKLPLTAAEELLEIIMRRYERTSTLVTSKRPVEDWASCWAMPPPPAPCSTASCATDTCSSAAHEAGEPKQACLNRSRQVKTIQSRTPSIGRF